MKHSLRISLIMVVYRLCTEHCGQCMLSIVNEFMNLHVSPLCLYGFLHSDTIFALAPEGQGEMYVLPHAVIALMACPGGNFCQKWSME